MIQKAVKDYVIRSYECDKNGFLRLVTLMNIFQDIADSHASELGVGMDYCQKNGFAWVGANYHIKISSYPKFHQKIIVQSWPSAEKKLGAYRDFLVTDEKGNEIICASSQWILIDFAKKRPLSLHDNLPQYTIINERALETDFSKIENISHPDSSTEFRIRFDDIDFNNHVNNSIYLLWATEAVDAQYRLSHLPQEIEISFKKEALLGDNISVITQYSGNETLHSIISLQDNRELSRLKIFWKNI